jgi:hypothetical protein
MNVEGVFRFLEKAMDGLYDEMAAAVKDALDGHVGKFKRRRLTRRSKTSLGRVTAQTSRSLVTEVKVKKSARTIRGRAFFSSKAPGVTRSQALINKITNAHERGATIVPRKRQWLTIPLKAAKTPSGQPRKRRARDWGNTFIARSRKGGRVIFQRRGRRAVPLYVLVKRVRLPARLNFASDWELAKRKKIMPALRARHAKFLRRIRSQARRVA